MSYFKDRHRHGGKVEDGHDLRGLMCQREGCGQTMHFVCTLAGIGAFCSDRCRDIAQKEHERKAERRTA